MDNLRLQIRGKPDPNNGGCPRYDFYVLAESYSGLDPVNTQIMSFEAGAFCSKFDWQKLYLSALTPGSTNCTHMGHHQYSIRICITDGIVSITKSGDNRGSCFEASITLPVACCVDEFRRLAEE